MEVVGVVRRQGRVWGGVSVRDWAAIMWKCVFVFMVSCVVSFFLQLKWIRFLWKEESPSLHKHTQTHTHTDTHKPQCLYLCGFPRWISFAHVFAFHPCVGCWLASWLFALFLLWSPVHLQMSMPRSILTPGSMFAQAESALSEMCFYYTSVLKKKILFPPRSQWTKFTSWLTCWKVLCAWQISCA